MIGDLPLLFLVLALVGAMGWWLMSQPLTSQSPVRIYSADPLLERARARAQGSLDRFRRLAAEHPSTAMVKLRIDRADGLYRGQWADVVRVGHQGLEAKLRGPGRAVDLSWDEVEDWQVEVQGGRWRGAFSVIAVWRIHERDSGQLPDGATRQLPRFLDA